MKRYRRWFIGGIFITLCAIGSINVALDANHLYLARDQVFRAPVMSYVDRLLASKDGLIQFPYERPFKIELARRAPAQCAVIGSSHEMQFGINNFRPARGCLSLVNLGVSGGSFEEFIIFSEVLMRRGATREMFVGVGPWMFRKGASARWIELRDEHAQAVRYFDLSERSILSSIEVKLTNIFNLQYLYVGLHNVVRSQPRSSFPDGFDIGGRSTADAITRPDGTLEYSKEYEERSANSSVGRGTYQLADPAIDMAVVRDFGAVLKSIKTKGAALSLVLTPYHPHVFSCRSELACRILNEVESEVRKLALEIGVEVVGSYKPTLFGLEPKDFYDDMHLKEHAIQNL